jgi:hypothetical protein
MNDECNVNLNSVRLGSYPFLLQKHWWYETRVKPNQVATSQGIFAGLVGDQITMGTDFHTDATMAMKVNPVIGFQLLDTAVWRTTYNKTGGTQTYPAAAAATATAGWTKLGMKCTTDGTTGTVQFYVNGVLISGTALSSATNFPLTIYAVPCWATKCGTAAANTLSVDWWYAAQLR